MTNIFGFRITYQRVMFSFVFVGLAGLGLISSEAYAAARWDLAAIAWGATLVAVSAASAAALPALMVAGVVSIGLHVGAIAVYWDDLDASFPGTNGGTRYFQVKLDPNIPSTPPPGWSSGPGGASVDSNGLVGYQARPPATSAFGTAFAGGQVSSGEASKFHGDSPGIHTHIVSATKASFESDMLDAVRSEYSATFGAATWSQNDTLLTFAGLGFNIPVQIPLCPDAYVLDNSANNCALTVYNGVTAASAASMPYDDQCETPRANMKCDTYLQAIRL